MNVQELCEELMKECEEKNIRLSAWEAEFLENIKDKVTLSQKQEEILTLIYEKL